MEVPEEDKENELFKQLKKALMVSNFQGSLQSDKVPEADELVAGMGGLSLSSNRKAMELQIDLSKLYEERVECCRADEGV